MYPVIGWGLSNLTNALNPVNQLKAAWGVVSNPFNPMKQTSAVLNLFRPGGGSAPSRQPPPGYGGAPPGWGPAPPNTPPPGWGAPPPFPGGGPPSWANAAPPPGGLSYQQPIPPTSAQPWGGQPPPASAVPMYDPNQYLAQTAPPMASDYGPDPTGWQANYGDPNSGAGW